MSFLVDTNVISVGAPAKSPAPLLIDWMDRNSDRLFVSTVTVAEIEDGIAKAPREDATRKAGLLAQWLETLLHLYASSILAFDLSAAHIAGQLSDLARGKGHAPGFADVAIAAIAKANGLTILTRNAKHFAPLGVATHDPFRTPPK